MFLVVHVTFPWLGENARSLHLQQANISLYSQKVQNDVFLRSLKKIMVYFHVIQITSVTLQSSATNFFFSHSAIFYGASGVGVTLQPQQIIDYRPGDRKKWLFIKKKKSKLKH